MHKSITVSRHVRYDDVIEMVWVGHPDNHDLEQAFINVQDLLMMDNVQKSIIVDLRLVSYLDPLNTVRKSRPVFENSQVKEWLVIGAIAIAKGVGSTLMAITRRRNIQWFHTVEQLQDYLTRSHLA